MPLGKDEFLFEMLCRNSISKSALWTTLKGTMLIPSMDSKFRTSPSLGIKHYSDLSPHNFNHDLF